MSALWDRAHATDFKVRAAAFEAARDEAPSGAWLGATEKALEDPAPEVRRAALATFGYWSEFKGLRLPDRIAQKILALTQDDSGRVRAEAGITLVLLGKTAIPGRLEALLGLLEDPAPGVRCDAAAALGDLGDPGAREPLAQHLSDDDEVRFEAAFALASLRDGRGRSILEAALESNRRRSDACEALRRLGDPAALPALSAAAERFMVGWADRLTLWATLYALGDHSVASKIIARLSSWRREERIYGVALIGSHHVADGLPLVRQMLRDSKHPLVLPALGALGAHGDPADVRLLSQIVAAHDWPQEARLEAIRALAKIPGSESVAALRAVQEEALGQAAQEALELIGSGTPADTTP